ncbi:MAG: ABC transporter permease [Coriobacteriia bacterium]|nr:ABC transporter permease [Coriobacteriia bacterium]
MRRAFIAELAKLRRSSLPWWTAIAVGFAPMMSNIFVTAQPPGYTAVSWPSFFELCSMTMGTWYGILLFGLITSYLFGREYAESSLPAVLTLPTRRECFVLAKFGVLIGWVFALAILSLMAQGVWASALGLDGFAWSAVWPTVGEVLTVAALVLLTQPIVALVAVIGRGVFAPMIFSAFGFSAGMIGGIAGWGEWLPWAMPTVVGGTFLGPVISTDSQLTTGSWAIALSVFVVGVIAVICWVNNADSRA